MDQVVQRVVSLPDGKRVPITKDPEAWWDMDEGSGYVSPDLLAPDPNQPRTHMEERQLAELAQSVGAIGVRQEIIVTPRTRATWVTLSPETAHLPFVIVSGHRRHAGAKQVRLVAVPIRVRVYDDEAMHRMDASLLNKNRVALSPLEEGWEIMKLRGLGFTTEAIRKAFGVSLPVVYNRIGLTRLAPDIQALLAPTVPLKDRLAATVGGMLGNVKRPTPKELQGCAKQFLPLLSEALLSSLRAVDPSSDATRFMFQRILLTVIQRRNMNSVRAVEFIREQNMFPGAGAISEDIYGVVVASKIAYDEITAAEAGQVTKRIKHLEAIRQPRNRRGVLLSLASVVTGTRVRDWSAEEIQRAFINTSPTEVVNVRRRFEDAITVLERIVREMKKI